MTTGRRQRGEFLECFRCSAPPPTSALRSPLEKMRADEQSVLTLKGVPDACVLPDDFVCAVSQLGDFEVHDSVLAGNREFRRRIRVSCSICRCSPTV